MPSQLNVLLAKARVEMEEINDDFSSKCGNANARFFRRMIPYIQKFTIPIRNCRYRCHTTLSAAPMIPAVASMACPSSVCGIVVKFSFSNDRLETWATPEFKTQFFSRAKSTSF
jgi:hypothetical protein